MPRLCKRLTNRSNYPTNTVVVYCRIAIFITLSDNVIDDLKTRFFIKYIGIISVLFYSSVRRLKKKIPNDQKVIAKGFQLLLHKNEISSQSLDEYANIQKVLISNF